MGITTEQTKGTYEALNIDLIREDFPALAQQVNGHPLAYLDNGATSQKPRPVINSLLHFYSEDCANVHRGLHTLSERATSAYEGARLKLRQFINARSAAEVIYVSGATEAINLVAQSFARPRLRPGDVIVTTMMEHHSNIVPWQLVCEQTGARLRAVPVHKNGELDLATLQILIEDRPRLLAITHVSNVLGTINPLEHIINIAHAHDVPVLVDGAQAAPHLAIDVQALDCDFYVFSGHKVYGPTGTGILYGKEALLEQMPPYRGGGEMILQVTFEKTTYKELPYKFEAGTPHIAGAIGLGAAVDYIKYVGIEKIARHEQQLLAYGHTRLAEVDGVEIIGQANSKTGIISFTLANVHPHDIATVLDQQGIAVRAGHHCAMPLMDYLGLAATTRASFALYNTSDEVDRLVMGLHKAKELFG